MTGRHVLKGWLERKALTGGELIELWKTLNAASFALRKAAGEKATPASRVAKSRQADNTIDAGALDRSGKLRFIEGMRGAAALYVALGHLCTMVDPARMVGFRDISPEVMQRFVACFSYGHVAVAIFIVISGFSLQVSLFTSGDHQMKRVKRFYGRRARRILPTYYASLAASLLVAFFVTPLLVARYHSPFSMYLPVDAPTLWSHVFLVHNWSPTWMYRINGVFWSIAIEVQLYLVFPLLVRGMSRFGRMMVLGLAVLAAVVALNVVASAPKLYPWFLPLFVSGMVGANFAYRPHLRLGVLPGVALALASVLVGLGVWSCSQGTNLPVQDGLFGAAAACAMYAMTVQPMHWLARGFRLRWMTFIGGFSYTLYLMHHPIEQLMFWFKPVGIQGPQAMLYQFLVSLPAVILGTWVFSLVFEKPFLSKPSKPVAKAVVVKHEPNAGSGAEEDDEPFLDPGIPGLSMSEIL